MPKQMVLIDNENQINIKNNHMLKCLEQKKNAFKVFIVPLTEILEETDIINDTKNILKDNILSLTDNEINAICNSK